MDKEYTWWRLVKNQYSWKNERSTFIIMLIISVLTVLINWSSGSLTYTDTGETIGLFTVVYFIYFLVHYTWLLFLYYSLKFLLLCVIACGFITYCSNSDDEDLSTKAKGMYDEMLYSRK